MTGTHNGKVARSYEASGVDFDKNTAGALAKGFVSTTAQGAIEEAKALAATQIIAGLIRIATETDALDINDWQSAITPHTLNKFITDLIGTLIFVPTGSIFHIAGTTIPTGFIELRDQTLLVNDYQALATQAYCGDANNATASWFYRCTNPASPSTTRSISGAYIKMPDGRGEFFRAWANDRIGHLNSGRSLWAKQNPSVGAHSHSYGGGAGGDTKAGGTYAAGEDMRSSPGSTLSTYDYGTGMGSETVPGNLSFISIMKT